MTFASPIPWWLAVLAAAALCAVAVRAYLRPLVPLSTAQRTTLTVLRAVALLSVLVLICRPMRVLPTPPAAGGVVPILVDVSRSMRITDADGESRLRRAASLLDQLLPALRRTGAADVYGFAERPAPADPAALEVTGARTELSAAIAQVQARYAGRPVPGIVVVTDGGETGIASSGDEASGIPLFIVGVGSAEGPPDREVTALAAGDPRIDSASVDLTASVVTRGLGLEPFDVRLLESGQVRDTARVTPRADGVPAEVSFSVFPEQLRASLYTIDVSADPREAVPENNQRSLVVNPAGRPRRILVLAGAPGFDHTFLMRALEQDPALEIDSVVRKGKNDANQDTFIVQAGEGRSAALTSGYPTTKEALFGYDAVILSNIEADFFTQAQLTFTAEFVGQRGGGFLVLGGRSFERRGFSGTALEVVLPVEATDRKGSLARTSGMTLPSANDAVALTDEGARHPVMRLGASADETRQLWSTLPALAATAPLGGARSGGSILAVTKTSNGAVLPVVAVQRFGRGRSMVFAGEASWRWRMLSPAGDRRYDTFWRQTARWLVADAPETVNISFAGSIDAGLPNRLTVEVLNARFEPEADAVVEASATGPDGSVLPLDVRPTGDGLFVVSMTPAVPGLYQVEAHASKADSEIGRGTRWIAAGNSAREFADPRLNEPLLRRLARESGGRYVRSDATGELPELLSTATSAAAPPQRRDLWHRPSLFLLVIALLAAEWVLRRTWGLR